MGLDCRYGLYMTNKYPFGCGVGWGVESKLFSIRTGKLESRLIFLYLI